MQYCLLLAQYIVLRDVERLLSTLQVAKLEMEVLNSVLETMQGSTSEQIASLAFFEP